MSTRRMNSINRLFRGNTVSVGSNAEKRPQDGNDCAIGDKVDLRVCTSSPSGKMVDLINIELAKDTSSTKLHADYRKVVYFQAAGPLFTSGVSGPHIVLREAKIGGVKGQISEVKLIDNGLYVASHSGSLSPTSLQVDLRNLRILLRRLHAIKSQVLGMKASVKTMEHREKASKKSMEGKQSKTRSLTPQLCSNLQ
ncbi:hypothetical protein INT47_004221 [Mucor saturninus]|uniref:Uncharacterized protein n=1 Tax=Mucor saturninus TaxID=64648 RepID=A0A8H7V8M7_9FUNG|nr:hypothetical protein INT47_004221 [Mucor saturninus]